MALEGAVTGIAKIATTAAPAATEAVAQTAVQGAAEVGKTAIETSAEAASGVVDAGLEGVAQEGLATGAQTALETAGPDAALNQIAEVPTEANTTPLDPTQATVSTEQSTQVDEGNPDADSVTGTPAEGMDLDPRYKTIQAELKQKWLENHPGEDLLSENGQNYTIRHLNPDQKNQPTLSSDTDRIFREKYLEDAKAYDTKENSRVYEDLNKDPAIRQVEEDIFRSTNLDSQVRAANTATGIDSYSNTWDLVNTRESIHAWDRFVDKYPDKAKAYAENHPGVENALKRHDERARQVATENSDKTAEPSAQDDQAEQQQLTPEQQKISQLEQKLNGLVAENAELKNSIAQINESLGQMKDVLTLLTQAMAEKEQDPKKKESLLAMIAKILAVIVIGSVIEGGKTVAPPIPQAGR